MKAIDKITELLGGSAIEIDEDKLKESINEVIDFYSRDKGDFDVIIKCRRVSAKSVKNRSKIIELVESEFGSGAATMIADILKLYDDKSVSENSGGKVNITQPIINPTKEIHILK